MAKKRTTEPKVILCRLYLPEPIHKRLVMLAVARGMKLSDVAAEVLDRGLPRYEV